ncbi:GNAT family N-acetyltransferase [Nisaea acidiphila]|uniref:GNAT family N-acetyltransferase n=1 Tax=Nisaea acidiphila TaxID=1862145 RepID=A0A9J7AS51_9PROT|nr:GNAT family N-acetyltransferase [Nisaea acidiphila]UUX49156.1 GNAT family N-acetyltransferase [Nisaea acidiphila]
MPDGEERTEAQAAISALRSIHEIAPEDWDACAGPENPFLSHAFLSALEDSGSVRAETGWLPQHLVFADETDRIAGIVPLYLKGHSQGEYVFDWGWADAYERAGGEYYPKLLSAVPFTPVTGPRLLIHPDAEQDAVRDILIGGLIEITRRFNVSSTHVNFLPEAQWQALGEAGFLQRVGLQYHWENDGYADFDAFLGALSSRKRKAIRKERKAAAESGLTIRQLTGDQIEPRHWDAFFRFYMDTSDRKWGSAYLTREFFDLLGERMADRVLLVIAELDGSPVAGALNLIGDDTLFGRNWGCIADFKFLHFELCYYQAIDFAIARGLKWVEAGAQGQHKIQRGYLPRFTYSAHLIPSPSFRDAVADFLRRERMQMEHEKEALENQSPFRHET